MYMQKSDSSNVGVSNSLDFNYCRQSDGAQRAYVTDTSVCNNVWVSIISTTPIPLTIVLTLAALFDSISMAVPFFEDFSCFSNGLQVLTEK